MRIKKILVLMTVPVILGACQQPKDEASEYKVQYVDSGKVAESESTKSENVKTEDKSIEEINAEEGIAAEQIVVKITEEGYVTTHGNHFHAYNGDVPADALIGERLFTDQEGEVLSDHEAGKIVRVGDEILFFLEDEFSPLLRTEEEIKSQSEGNDPGQTWPGAEFRNEKGQYTTDDGYVFDPSDVEADLGDAYLVPTDKQEHVIPKDRLTKFEIAMADRQLKKEN